MCPRDGKHAVVVVVLEGEENNPLLFLFLFRNMYFMKESSLPILSFRFLSLLPYYPASYATTTPHYLSL